MSVFVLVFPREVLWSAKGFVAVVSVSVLVALGRLLWPVESFIAVVSVKNLLDFEAVTCELVSDVADLSDNVLPEKEPDVEGPNDWMVRVPVDAKEDEHTQVHVVAVLRLWLESKPELSMLELCENVGSAIVPVDKLGHIKVHAELPVTVGSEKAVCVKIPASRKVQKYNHTHS